MSGGVDSSVAACLLLEQGYDVVGSHMSLVHLDGVEHGCCGPAARNDAAEVARIAGFPFEICDLSDEFERTVIGDFVSEHEAGRTPNPCARCNGEIKFGAFLRRADELGIDAVATGHYVRSDRWGGRLRLLRGADRAKDQSYMLHMLGQDELSRSRFPVGGMPKADTRAAAERFGLPVANKPDSQELCFAPSGKAGAYLASVAPHLMRDGEVVDTDGRVLARHGGSAAFTVGQRRGVGVAVGERRYVVDVDAASATVTIGTRRDLARDAVQLRAVTFVDREIPRGARVQVQTRAHGEPVDATVDRDTVVFASPQSRVAPGQVVAFYDGEYCLGGGLAR